MNTNHSLADLGEKLFQQKLMADKNRRKETERKHRTDELLSLNVQLEREADRLWIIGFALENEWDNEQSTCFELEWTFFPLHTLKRSFIELLVNRLRLESAKLLEEVKSETDESYSETMRLLDAQFIQEIVGMCSGYFLFPTHNQRLLNLPLDSFAAEVEVAVRQFVNASIPLYSEGTVDKQSALNNVTSVYEDLLQCGFKKSSRVVTDIGFDKFEAGLTLKLAQTYLREIETIVSEIDPLLNVYVGAILSDMISVLDQLSRQVNADPYNFLYEEKINLGEQQRFVVEA